MDKEEIRKRLEELREKNVSLFNEGKALLQSGELHALPSIIEEQDKIARELLKFQMLQLEHDIGEDGIDPQQDFEFQQIVKFKNIKAQAEYLESIGESKVGCYKAAIEVLKESEAYFAAQKRWGAVKEMVAQILEFHQLIKEEEYYQKRKKK